MTAYYNEFDPYAAEWLRNLIKAGHIASGDVDSRSIVDVSADDLKGYTQCHFFAGIGVWSHALRLSGWGDDRPIWTGSCPCQPFSVAGKGEGQADERHLWPVWFKLIKQCRPPVVFGEQVEAAIRHGWLDLVQGDLESIGYASGAVCIPAGSVGAPHIRQRLWFVAHHHQRLERHRGNVSDSDKPGRNGAKPIGPTGPSSWVSELADSERGSAKPGRQHLGGAARETEGEVQEQRVWDESGAGNDVGELADTKSNGRSVRDTSDIGAPHAQGDTPPNASRGAIDGQQQFATHRPSPTDHFWRDADWLLCRDGKWRPVEPGTLPLVNGATSRVGRLRAYGNAIVPQVAQEVIEAFMAYQILNDDVVAA